MLSPQQKLWFQVPKNPEEFYDLKEDPFELNNLISEKKYSTEIDNLKNKLGNWIKEINDLGHLTENELVKRVTK
jgi:hypothetical protein